LEWSRYGEKNAYSTTENIEGFQQNSQLTNVRVLSFAAQEWLSWWVITISMIE